MELFQSAFTFVSSLFKAIGPDAICLIVVVIFAAIGWYKGFIKSAIQLVGGIAVLVLAFFISTPIAEKAYDAMFKERIQTTVEAHIVSEDVEAIKLSIEGILKDIPSPVYSFLESAGFNSSEDVFKAISATFDGTKKSAVDGIVNNVMKPVTVSLLRWFCFVLIVMLGMIVVSIISGLIGSVVRISGVESIDKSLGVAIGVVQGVVVVFVAVTLISVLIKSGSISASWMSDSRIIKFVDTINPSTKMINETFQSIFK